MLRCLGLFISILLFFSNNLYASERIDVAILPFEVNAPDEFAYLNTQMPDIISKQLKKDGAFVIDPAKLSVLTQGKDLKDLNRIRQVGKQIDADYIVWGGLTLQEDSYSINVKMMPCRGQKPAQDFLEQGKGIENLPATLQTITQQLSLKILKHKQIAKLLVEGNKRIESDAIIRVIKTKPNDIYAPERLSKNLKSVYNMGYFEDVKVEAEESPEGKVVIFRVKERATIRKIRFKGNKVYDEDELTEEALTISTGSILNIFKINSDIKRIEDLYKDKNYHNASITHKIHPLKNNQADLEFVIKEGKKIKIKTIVFEGNNAYSVRKLKKNMKTKKKGFFSWLTSSGELNMEDLNQDIMRLTSFYHINGYIQSRVGEPHIEYKGEWIYLTIKIEEGPQFKVGNVDVDGDLIFPKEILIKGLKIGGEKVCNRKVLQDDVIALTDLYSDKGYFKADISPRLDKDFETLTADITFIIRKGDPVYFEKILIGGNIKTRDKVIRRELNVYEQELYSGRQLKRGVRNLHRLDYFEDIKVNTVQGSQEDKVLLKVDVEEKPTGMFTFGAGYSSVEHLFGTVSVSQRNLFGRGQTLGVKAELGGSTNTYSLSFTEPWLLDIPLSAGFSLYNQEKDYDTYDRDQTGGSVRFSYPVFDYTRAYISYAYSISDIDVTDEVYASQAVKDLKGSNITSSVSTTLKYDTRDRMMNATEGSEYSLTVKYAGSPFGGDIAFTKYIGEAGWYIPIAWDFVYFMHAKGGYVVENKKGKLPEYERFFLGGMNTLRGFDYRDVTPMDPPGDINGIKVGGNKMLQFNFELQRPLFKEAGLVLIVFYDMGNAYDDHEKVDISNVRESWGYGVRWYSPIGPIRLEYGRIIDPLEGEDRNGNWEFTMGSAF